MIRTLAIILALSTSFAALSAVEASAQVTEQTDKSEEDWRKSQKKRDSSDIFEDILNRRSTGQGNGTYPQNPIDSLPEESRRHLMKERAKVIAESDPGTSPDAPYSPSEAAKTDPDLAEQEKEAWTVIMTDMKTGSSSGQGQAGTGPNKIAIAGQGGGQGDSNSQERSVMRGGSSQSVADILAQIKGIKSAGGGQGGDMGGSGRSDRPSTQGPLGTGTGQQQGSQGQGASGQGTSGQSSERQSQSDADAKPAQQAQAQAQAQEKAEAAGEAAAEAQAQADSAAQAAQQAEAIAQAKGDSTSKMKAEIANDIAQMAQAKADKAAQDAAQAKAETEAQAQTQLAAEAQAAAQAEAIEKAKQAPEPIGPLDRIKREREERTAGTQTSASDYLKTSKE